MIDSVDHDFLRMAIEEAESGLREGGVPIGASFRRGSALLGRGHNRRVQQSDPMAHAEIDCLRSAGRQRAYKDTVLYSTLMPCYLCAGAIVQFGIPRVVVGEATTFEGAAAFLRQHGVVIEVLNDARCIALMTEFIEKRPDVWFEDIGK